MAIKDNAYITLQKLGGRATETQLVKEYIKMYPDYDQNYTLTKTPSEAKIRGTINAELMRNSLHEKIKIDKTKEVVAFCKISLRGYEAECILEGEGFDNVKVLEGGIMSWPFRCEK